MNTNLLPHLLKAILTVSMLVLGTTSTNTVFAQNGDNPLIVDADESLQWLRGQSQYIATGNARAEQGDLLLTANVITADYDPEIKTEGDHDANSITNIRGEGNARLVRATLIATARTITYDILSELIELKGGRPQVVNDGGTLNASKTIIYDRATHKITALGQAQIRLADGQELHGDNIVIMLNNDENDIETITATGKAMAISTSEKGKQQAEANEIFYTHATGIAILTGNVRLQDNNNFMTGNRAEIDTISGISIMSADQNDERIGGVLNPAE